MSFQEYLKEVINGNPDVEYQSGMKALEHLKQALVELKNADKNKSGHYEDWKYYISEVEELISTDNGEAGLEALVSHFMPHDEIDTEREMPY